MTVLAETASELVLACMLKDGWARNVHLATLQAADFPVERERLLLAALRELWDQDVAIDLQSVHRQLVLTGHAEKCPASWWAALPDSIPSAANVRWYISQLQRDSERRLMLRVAEQAATEDVDPEVLASRLRDARRRDIEMITAPELSVRVTTEIDRAAMRGNTISGVPSGMPGLDHRTGGFQPGELIILGARPSVGKTAMVISWLAHTMLRGIPVALFSLEMSEQALGLRLVACESGINPVRLTRNPSEHDIGNARRVLQKLWDAPLWVSTSPKTTVADVRHQTAVLQARERLRMVVVDYLGLLEPRDRGVSRYEQVTEISRDLKMTAMDLRLPIIALCQVRRETEQEKRPPRLSDLRESGAIEQDADVVLLLHRERDESANLATLGRLVVAKQRNGLTGALDVRFDPTMVTFREEARKEDE